MERTTHVKVYVSFAQFELSVPEEEAGDNVARARQVFDNAYKAMKEKELKEEVGFKLSKCKSFQYGQLIASRCSVLSCSNRGKISKKTMAQRRRSRL